MATLVDCRFDALRTQGFSGSISDMMHSWLQANGATAATIPDSWKEMLDIIQPPDPDSKVDQWYIWLRANGYGAPNHHINDMLMDFWCSGGTLVPKPPSSTSYSAAYSIGYS